MTKPETMSSDSETSESSAGFSRDRGKSSRHQTKEHPEQRNGGNGGTGGTGGNDYPPNSRLFILYQKGISEEEFRCQFAEFGTIEDVWVIKDKQSNQERGIVYIKFSKTSEAMQAMDEMPGKTVGGTTKKVLKCVVANSKKKGSQRDPREDEKLVRLFVIIPKTFSDQDLKDEFSKYGEVANVTVLKDRKSGDSKGFGYVKFNKPFHAALGMQKPYNMTILEKAAP